MIPYTTVTLRCSVARYLTAAGIDPSAVIHPDLIDDLRDRMDVDTLHLWRCPMGTWEIEATDEARAAAREWQIIDERWLPLGGYGRGQTRESVGRATEELARRLDPEAFTDGPVESAALEHLRRVEGIDALGPDTLLAHSAWLSRLVEVVERLVCDESALSITLAEYASLQVESQRGFVELLARGVDSDYADAKVGALVLVMNMTNAARLFEKSRAHARRDAGALAGLARHRSARDAALARQAMEAQAARPSSWQSQYRARALAMVEVVRNDARAFDADLALVVSTT